MDCPLIFVNFKNLDMAGPLLSDEIDKSLVPSFFLTHKNLEMHRYIISTAATDALVLKHQVISIHSADWILVVLG